MLGQESCLSIYLTEIFLMFTTIILFINCKLCGLLCDVLGIKEYFFVYNLTAKFLAG